MCAPAVSTRAAFKVHTGGPRTTDGVNAASMRRRDANNEGKNDPVRGLGISP